MTSSINKHIVLRLRNIDILLRFYEIQRLYGDKLINKQTKDNEDKKKLLNIFLLFKNLMGIIKIDTKRKSYFNICFSDK